MDITYNTALEIACHEALVRQAYKDSRGIWTWSIGLTKKSGHRVNRYIGNPQTVTRCLEVYVWALGNYADDVRAEFEGQNLTEAEFAAALSFHWNTGSIASASWVDHWKAGDMAAARDSFMDWDKPPEIVDRREAEADLLFDGVWSNDGRMTEYTRVRSSGAPDWGSAKRIDVSDELRALLAPETPEPEGEEPDAVRALARIAEIIRPFAGASA